MTESSKFIPYSMGRVAADKELNSREILVVPIEIIPFRDGALDATMEEDTAAGVDRSGKAYQDKVTTGNTVRAEWLNQGGSNRATAPDVVKGERVQLYRYGTANKYYWVSLGLDDGMRKKETIIWRFANNTDKSDIEGKDENSAWLEISTHKKTFTFHTSGSDGEQYTYAMQFNGDTGQFIVTDNENNKIVIYSEAKKIQLMNSVETEVTIADRDINIVSADSVNIKTKLFKVDAETIEFNATQYDITSKVSVTGDSDITGKVDITGATGIKGETTTVGNVAIGGNVIATGTMAAAGGVSSKGKDVSSVQHKHSPDGSPPMPEV